MITHDHRVTVGKGSYHFQSLKNRKGEVNKDPRAGKPYSTASFDELIQLAAAPTVCPKRDSYWMLASTYNQPDARTFAVQAAKGDYAFLLVDIDKDNKSLADVCAALQAVLPNTRALIDATSSASEFNRKWHITIPLTEVMAYDAFDVYQRTLFNALAAQGIQCDTSLARAAQLFFLPSIPHVGAYYEYTVLQGEPYDIRHGVLLHSAQQLFQTEYAAKQQAERATRGKTASANSIINWFNTHTTAETIMEQYGYTFNGYEWASPLQQKSGDGHSTKIWPNGKWFSFSDSDADVGLGEPHPDGRFGDSFDLVKHFAFKGSEKLALTWARERRKLADPVTPYLSILAQQWTTQS